SHVTTWRGRMRYSLACALLIACVAVPFAGQADEWHRYKNTVGNFSVLVPVEPQDSVNPASEGQVSHTIQALHGGIGYTIVFVAMSAAAPVDDATFKVYRDSFMKGLPNCEMATEAAAAPAIQGYIGHWYRMNCVAQNKKLTFTGNLYWGKHYAYAVLA